MDEQEKSNEIVEVKDASGELQRQREEALKQKIEVRKKALVDLVVRQTDYDEDKAMIKYDEYQEKLPPEPDLSEYFEWLEFLDKSIKNAERQIVDKARDNGKLLFSLWS